MGSIHFIGGEKGGVGKSLTARLLAQYFIDHGQTFIGFDADQSHSTFSRFYADYTTTLDVEKYDNLDEIVAAAESEPDTNILVDLAAQTGRHLNQWVEDSDSFGIFTELNRPVYLWHVMDDGADSAFLLDKLLDSKPEGAQIVVVMNKGRGENFQLFERSPTYRKAQEQGAVIITLKQLQPALMQKVDFSNLSFWAAANNRDLVSLVERKRVTVWMENCYAQFDQVFGGETAGRDLPNTPSEPVDAGTDDHGVPVLAENSDSQFA